MSVIIRCDGSDCNKCDHSDDEIFYSVSRESQSLIYDVIEERPEHLCLDCFDEINKELEDKLVLDSLLEYIDIKKSQQ